MKRLLISCALLMSLSLGNGSCPQTTQEVRADTTNLSNTWDVTFYETDAEATLVNIRYCVEEYSATVFNEWFNGFYATYRLSDDSNVIRAYDLSNMDEALAEITCFDTPITEMITSVSIWSDENDIEGFRLFGKQGSIFEASANVGIADEHTKQLGGSIIGFSIQFGEWGSIFNAHAGFIRIIAMSVIYSECTCFNSFYRTGTLSSI